MTSVSAAARGIARVRPRVGPDLRYTLLVFLGSRILVVALAASAGTLFLTGQVEQTTTPWVVAATHDLGRLTDILAFWDGAHFVRIAQHGYASIAGAAAFYPVYPTLIGVGGRLSGGHYVTSAIVISSAATLAAFLLIGRLTTSRIDAATGRRAVLYLAIFPMTIFLIAVYSEAIYLALSLAAFLLAERRRWGAAGIATGAAMLTRPVGAALLLALLVYCWDSEGPRFRNALRLLVAVPIFAAYPLLLWQQIGDPLGFLHAETLWQRSLSDLGPLGGLWDGARAALAGLEQLFVGGRVYWVNPHLADVNPNKVALQNIEQFLYVVVYLILAVIAWRRLGRSYGVFAFASLAIPLAEPTPPWPLQSIQRFGLAVFPLFIALATLGRGRRSHVAIVTVCSALLAVDAVKWGLGWWVS